MGVDQAKLPRSVSRQLPASSETNGNKNRKSEICESERKVLASGGNLRHSQFECHDRKTMTEATRGQDRDHNVRANTDKSRCPATLPEF